MGAIGILPVEGDQTVNLLPVFRVVADGSTDLVEAKAKELGRLRDVAIGPLDGFDDLPHIETATFDRRLASSRCRPKDDPRVLLASETLIEKGASQLTLLDAPPPRQSREILLHTPGKPGVKSGV